MDKDHVSRKPVFAGVGSGVHSMVTHGCSEGRWQAHLQHASTLLEDGGRIGAVLPMSARRHAVDLLPAFDLEFSEPIENAFSGTSISVLLLKATKR